MNWIRRLEMFETYVRTWYRVNGHSKPVFRDLLNIYYEFSFY